VIKFGPFTPNTSIDEASQLADRQPDCKTDYKFPEEDDRSIAIECELVHVDGAAITALKFTPSGQLIAIGRWMALPADVDHEEALSQALKTYGHIGEPVPQHKPEGIQFVVSGCQPDNGKILIGYCWGDSSWYVGVMAAELPDQLRPLAHPLVGDTPGRWLVCSWVDSAADDLNWDRITKEHADLEKEREQARKNRPKPQLKF
jgi:hypothetical protein